MSAQPKGYELKEFALLLGDGDISTKTDLSELKFSGENAFDLRDVCSNFNYYEAVESPVIRCEFLIYDTVDLISGINGNEYIRLVLTTDTAPDTEIEVVQKIFKVGEVTKSERAVTYILYTTSPGAHLNEANRVFKSFTDEPGSAVVNKVEKDYLNRKVKHKLWEEARGNFNFISPSWRAYDVISYVQDKIVGSVSGRPGYLYWETSRGTNFATMDMLCSEANPSFTNPIVYTYEQANVGAAPGGDLNAFKIESINYPDRANTLERLRSGTFSNTVLGITMPALTSGFLPSSGTTSDGKKDSSPSGSINPPINMGAKEVWGMSKHLNKGFPFFKVNDDYFSPEKPARIKIRALPSMKNAQNSANPDGNAGNMTFDTIQSSAYSTSRWQLLNAIKLDIKVPGNASIAAGDVINVRIPSSQSQSGRIELDEMYSGKYLVLGLKHTYTKSGITTSLNLAKDSIL